METIPGYFRTVAVNLVVFQLPISVLCCAALLLGVRFFRAPGLFPASLAFCINAIQLISELVTGWLPGLTGNPPESFAISKNMLVFVLAVDFLGSLCFIESYLTVKDTPPSQFDARLSFWFKRLNWRHFSAGILLFAFYLALVRETDLYSKGGPLWRVLVLCPNVVFAVIGLILFSRTIRNLSHSAPRSDMTWARRAIIGYAAIQPLYLLRALLPHDATSTLTSWQSVALIGYYSGYLFGFTSKAFFFYRLSRGLGRAMLQTAAQAEEYVRIENLRVMIEGVAHTFRQPIGIISPLLDTLDQLSRSENAHRVSDEIRRQVMSMDRLIERLLTLRRGKEKETSLVRASDIVRDAEFRLRRRRTNDLPKTIKLDFKSYVPSQVHVRVVPDLLAPTIDAILDNAVDAIQDSKRPRIALHIKENEELRELRIECSNSGAAIPSDTAHNLFTPFFTTKGTGTGLGLFFAREYVVMQDGTLEYVPSPSGSDPGLFRITLQGTRRGQRVDLDEESSSQESA